MAKQKSGLGRGLNALFDDSPLNHTQPTTTKNTEVAKEEKKETVKEQQPEKHVAEMNNNNKTSSSPVTSTPEPTPKPSSNIYFSEDALENAKVVSREARPKTTTREPVPRERATGFFQHKSTKTISPQPNRTADSGINHSHASHSVATPSKGKANIEAKLSAVPNTKANKEITQGVEGNKEVTPEKPKDEKGMTGVVPLDKVQPNPDQPRTNFKPEEIEELANSIKKEGLLQPILVRKIGDHYQIIAGERRWQACKALKMTEIPVRFWAADNDKALELALIENIQRTDLNPIEEAYGYKRLMERRGMTQSEVAQTVSKGRSTIANALRLLDLPEEAQQLLFEEKITAGHARAILSIPDAEGRKTLTNKLIHEKLSVRETESIARLLSGRAQAKEKGDNKRVPAPASFKKAARGLTRFLSVPVKVKSVKGKNKIEIQFKDEAELERILNLIAEHASAKEAQTDAE